MELWKEVAAMKVADVRLGWTRSVSTDLQSRKVEVTVNGETNVYEVGPEVPEYLIEVKANSSVQFRTTVFDKEGKQVSSETASFVLGDLEDPQPDTDLFHEILGIRDVEDAPPTPPPAE